MKGSRRFNEPILDGLMSSISMDSSGFSLNVGTVKVGMSSSKNELEVSLLSLWLGSAGLMALDLIGRHMVMIYWRRN